MAEKKYLDKLGLTYLVSKIKALIPTKTSDLTNDSDFTTDDLIIVGDENQITENTKLLIEDDEPDIVSEVVNSLEGNEIAKAPSVRTVNEALENTEIYSTDEVKIGTWMGKPLYRKVYIGTITTGGTNYNYNDITGLSNTIDQLVRFGGYFDNNASGDSKILNTLPNAWLNATYFPNEHRIRVYSYDKTWFPINSSYYLVVEYTKTTD